MWSIHLGLIPDGNRRWAREHGLPPLEGHRRGAQVMENFLKWCLKNEIEEVSVYLLSIENILKRPRGELEEIFKTLSYYLDRLATDEIVHENHIKIRVVGKINELPSRVEDSAKRAEESTKHYKRHFLNLLVAYGGIDELLKCIQVLSKKKRGRITKELLEENLWISRPLDLIIRTGGECRLSNFLLYQSAHAQIFFIKKYWPDFTKEDLEKCLEEFKKNSACCEELSEQTPYRENY